MTEIVSLEDAQAHLSELIDRLQPGDKIVITRNHQPVAGLVAEGKSGKKPRKSGTLKGSVLYMASDFDSPLEDFKE